MASGQDLSATRDAFNQQGSLDWANLSKSTLSYSFDVLWSLAAANVNPVALLHGRRNGGFGSADYIGVDMVAEVMIVQLSPRVFRSPSYNKVSHTYRWFHQESRSKWQAAERFLAFADVEKLA
ncbi:hypothetical protein F4778DRAFT_777589 [Xylariomycetidae sp. FL2044]|nr:hypothetical protein F4778DRAFT_777589 [Xylariomycetidae sp. FL2044]